MKISIITATYNSASTIKHSLQSVSEQEQSLVEHIIIDGDSTDETMRIVSSFPHLKIKISERDAGIYDAMNKGIQKASGEIIGILNSDDFYASSQVLSEVVSVFERTNCDALYGDLEYVDKDDITRVIRYWKSGSYRSGAFKWGWMPPHPTFFVKREVYEKYGLFKLGMKTAADYELMLRFIHKERIKLEYIPSVLVKMRTGGASNRSLLSRLQANEDDRTAWAINGIKPYWFTLYLKPLRKISQFIIK
jgi:glycosyltransferase